MNVDLWIIVTNIAVIFGTLFLGFIALISILQVKGIREKEKKLTILRELCDWIVEVIEFASIGGANIDPMELITLVEKYSSVWDFAIGTAMLRADNKIRIIIAKGIYFKGIIVKYLSKQAILISKLITVNQHIINRMKLQDLVADKKVKNSTKVLGRQADILLLSATDLLEEVENIIIRV